MFRIPLGRMNCMKIIIISLNPWDVIDKLHILSKCVFLVICGKELG